MPLISPFFNHLNIKDFIDILIVAILIYQLLLIVRGTKAAQMIVGLAFLFGLFWLGITFKLYSLNWVLAHFFDSFFIIVVVLFQDQFRSALASVGTRRNILTVFDHATFRSSTMKGLRNFCILQRWTLTAFLNFRPCVKR